MPDDWAKYRDKIQETILVLTHYFRVWGQPASTPAVGRNVPKAAPGPSGPEQRRLPRKSVVLSGVIADLDDEQSWDCMIHDINAGGAAIGGVGRLPVGAQLYLLDTQTRSAHLARVVWSNDTRSGLLLIQSYTMGLGLPPKMRFLWRLLLEEKLRQANRAVEMGVAPELALGSVGLTREHVHQMARYAGADKRFQSLLHRVERLLKDEE